MTKPQLYYFGFRGRTEISRLTMAAAAVEFDFHTLDMADCKDDLDIYLFGQVPRLVIDGISIVQNKVIVRYIAHKYNLYPEDLQDKQNAEAIIDYFDDFFSSYSDLIYRDRLAEDAKAKYWETHGNKDNVKARFVGGHFEFLARLIRKNSKQSGFVFGKSLTVADVIIYHLTFIHARPTLFRAQLEATYPELMRHLELVEAIPSIRQYLSSPLRLPHTQGNGLGDD